MDPPPTIGQVPAAGPPLRIEHPGTPLPAPPPPDPVPSRPAPPARFRFGALRHRNYRLFISGQFISLAGTWMQAVAQGWLVLQLTNSPFQVGLVTTMGTLPILLFTLPGGVIADRVDKRRVVFLLQALMLVDALALGGLTATGRVTVTWVMALAVFNGILTAFEVPARQAFVVDLVAREDLTSAIALNASAFNVTRVIGPSVAGVLIATVGIAACFFVNAVSYVAVLAGLAMLRLPPHLPGRRGGGGWSALAEGTRYIRETPWPRALILLTATYSIFGYAVLPMLSVFARDALGAGAGGYGFLVASVGVGAAAGSLFLAAVETENRRRPLLFAGGILFGVLIVLAAISRTYAIATVWMALTGLAMILTNVSVNTLLQTEAPDALRGRVMGFYSFVVLGMAPFGAFQMGWLADHLGIRAAFAIGGAACIAVSVLVAWRMRRIPTSTLVPEAG
ncbi:MAG: MFS transporter [Gemmatimonadales bacterium]